jgi:gamma-glutamylcyclotransferase (GGCT)/AIG2-like uncharacterized protein YtfP
VPRAEAVELLFTYGTLMQGYALHHVLGPRSAFLGLGRVSGILLDLGPYPGLIAGRGTVRGELYRLAGRELLPVLDREEGYNFQRSRTLVTRDGGGTSRAWVYRYRGARTRAVRIRDGDYRQAHPRPASR